MKVGDTFSINYNGTIREFRVTKIQGAEYSALHADLKRRGWDGNTYSAESAPKGRQRKTFKTMFLKGAKNGEMRPIY